MKIKILGRDFTVTTAKERDAGTKIGISIPHKGSITISEDIPPDSQVEVLIHEITHCISTALLDPELTENEILAISSGLFAVIMDNKLDFVALAKKGLNDCT